MTGRRYSAVMLKDEDAFSIIHKEKNTRQFSYLTDRKLTSKFKRNLEYFE